MLLDLLVAMSIELAVPPCLHLFGGLSWSDFMKESRVWKHLLAFLLTASSGHP